MLELSAPWPKQSGYEKEFWYVIQNIIKMVSHRKQGVYKAVVSMQFVSIVIVGKNYRVYNISVDFAYHFHNRGNGFIKKNIFYFNKIWRSQIFLPLKMKLNLFLAN